MMKQEPKPKISDVFSYIARRKSVKILGSSIRNFDDQSLIFSPANGLSYKFQLYVFCLQASAASAHFDLNSTPCNLQLLLPTNSGEGMAGG
jgi:hypothetical protein